MLLINKINIPSKITISFLLFFSLAYSNYYTLKTMNIDSKINGVIIILELDSLPDQKNISAWQANTGWFYITLYKCRLMADNGLKKNIHEDIIAFQLIDNKESLQLGLKIKKPIEQFNFTQYSINNTITASLHYHTEIFANVDQNDIIKAYYADDDRGLSRGIRTWLNTTGISLAILGLLKNGNTSNNSLTIAGLSIIAGTFVLDRILKDF